MIKKIPLFVASGLCLFSVSQIFISNLIGLENGYFVYETDLIVGLCAIGLVWLSMLINKKVWVVLFLIALLISFSDLLAFSRFGVSLSLGPMTVNLIALALTISHFSLNGLSLQFMGKTENEKADEYEHKVSFFMKKFENKSTDELAAMENEELALEAKEAVKRLIGKGDEL